MGYDDGIRGGEGESSVICVSFPLSSASSLWVGMAQPAPQEHELDPTTDKGKRYVERKIRVELDRCVAVM